MGFYEPIPTLILSYSLLSGSFYTFNLFDIHIENVTSLDQFYLDISSTR